MNVVDLANAYKLSGDEEKSTEVLALMDWSAVGPEFKVSIAAVKGDVDEVVRLMRKIGVNDDRVGAQGYQEWPVFYGVHENEKFTSALKEVFGLDYVPSAKEQAGLSQVIKLLDTPDTKDERPDFSTRTLN
jgi:hypothetical protein